MFKKFSLIVIKLEEHPPLSRNDPAILLNKINGVAWALDEQFILLLIRIGGKITRRFYLATLILSLKHMMFLYCCWIFSKQLENLRSKG